jgi:hypothetical protein
MKAAIATMEANSVHHQYSDRVDRAFQTTYPRNPFLIAPTNPVGEGAEYSVTWISSMDIALLMSR